MSETSFSKTLSRLWPYMWPEKRLDLKIRIGAALALLLLAKVVTMFVPYTFKWATDALAETKDATSLLWLSPIALTLLYGAFRSCMQILTQIRDALFAAVAMNAVRRLALKVFVHMHELSLRFHLERKTGGLTRVLERGRSAIETLVRMAILQAMPTLVEFVMILAVFFVQFDSRYVVTLCLMIIAYLGFTALATNWRIALRRSMNESDTDANAKAIDSLLNYETVKYFNAEVRESHRYDHTMARYERTSVASYISLAILNAGQGVIFAAGLCGAMLLCVQDIRAGTHSVGDFVLINAILVQLYIPLNFIGTIYRELRQAIIDIETMFHILEQNPEISDLPGAQPLQIKAGGHVRFENVHFGYVPERSILNGIHFEIPPGQTFAVVGPSGAGKSTLSRLLFRFYEPQQGRILIDDQDIQHVTQDSLRAAIGMVPQDTVLFNDTIGYNIRYGKWDAAQADIEQAAEAAQIDRFIRMIPGGYEAQVGERGLKLSGGEKQRIAIARTLLKAPPLLVLDEATSALDSFTERDIQVALEKMAQGRTTLVIAHRLSTIVHADQILVLDHGIIKERGTHPHLLAQGGLYAKMWDRQQELAQAAEALKRAEEAEREM